MMPSIAENIEQVRTRIQLAAQQFHRPVAAVQLIAVSKTQPAAAILAALAAGQYAFGENYVQEAVTKIEALKNETLEWHFIGSIQSNKTKLIANHFAWVHSVDSIKIAERLHQQRAAHLPPLNICIEVNTSAEATKSGINLNELLALATAIQQLPRLKLRGLMTIPAPTVTLEQQRIPYRKLHDALVALQAQGFAVDTLSMGMSHDLEAAIAEGSTMVRIGTAIFGPRLR